MITFDNYKNPDRILTLINNCINEMVEDQLDMCYATEVIPEFIRDYFPEYICREDPIKCMNIIMDLKEWTKDLYIHKLTCLHEYAFFKIYNAYFDCLEDVEKFKNKNEKNWYKFEVKNIQQYDDEEKEIIRDLNNRDFYEELFQDPDFAYIEEIINLYQTNKKLFYYMGVDIEYYLELLPKDIREEIKESLQDEKNKQNKDEDMLIKQIKNAIKLRERYPERLTNMSEDDLSDDIKDIVQMKLDKEGFIIEREARGGYSNKKTGENDFYIYKIENDVIKQIAIGENKIWNKFDKQIKQLIRYMNENIKFGFTIVFNKTEETRKVKEKQIEILQKNKSELNIINIIKKEDSIISIHINPENQKQYLIYHLIANSYHPNRKKIAIESRK